MKSTPPIPCLYPECRHTAAVNGLCWGHYKKATFLVRKGYTTWTELASHGKCRVPGPQGGAGHLPKERKFDYSWFMLDGRPLPADRNKMGLAPNAQ